MEPIQHIYLSKAKNLKGREDEVVFLYTSFSSILELSKKFNTSETSITTLLKKRGINLRTKKEARNLKEYNEKFGKTKAKIKDPEKIQKIINLYNDGYSMLEISSMFEVNNVSIGKILKKNNIKLRNMSETHSHPHVLNRKKELFYAKHGVTNPQQVTEFFQKTQKNKYKTKNLIIDNKMFSGISGYEDRALNYILKTNLNINANDILAGNNSDIPKIRYKHNSKNKIYYPDIFIPKLNLLIEVKSQYTYDNMLEINLVKQQASKEAGFNHKILIFNYNGELISEV